MARLQIGDWELDTTRLLATRGADEVRLSTNEVDLLAYLAKQDEPVSRKHLLQEVFGYAPGARSRAVDMALLRLREKLEEDPSNPVVLCSRRSAGVWLEQPRPQPEQTPVVPVFGTPYFPREALEQRATALLEGGWRVISLVGPGGAGKTRLALQLARQMQHETIVCSIAGCASADDIGQRIARAAGISSGGTEAIRRALEKRSALTVLDEADLCMDAARDLIASIPSSRFVITSRTALGIPEEAVVPVQGMDREAARSFLDARLAASRWVVEPPPDDVVEALLDASDALPLALELAASYQDGPEQLLGALQAGTLPGTAWIDATIERSVTPLPPAALDLLRHLSLIEAPLPRTDIVDWHGAAADESLQILADRSLVVPRRAGWLVLRTVRSYVLTLEADWEAVRADVHAWLARKALALYELHKVDPRDAFRQWRPLLGDMLEALDHVAPASLPAYTMALYAYADPVGPDSTVEHVLRTALGRLPDHPMINGVAAELNEYDYGRDRIQLALDADDPLTRAVGFQALCEVSPRDLDIDLARETLPQIEDPFVRMGVERNIALHLSVTGQGADALRALVPKSMAFPIQHIYVLFALSGAYRREGRAQEALTCLDQAIEFAGGIGMQRAELFLIRSRAAVLGTVDPRAGAEALLAAADETERAGDGGEYARWMAGICLYGVGELERAEALLDTVVPGLNVERGVGWLVLQAARLRLGTGDTVVLQSFAPEDFPFNNPDGSPAGETLAVWVRGELDRHTGARSTEAIAQACAEASKRPILPRLAMLLRELANRP